MSAEIKIHCDGCPIKGIMYGYKNEILNTKNESVVEQFREVHDLNWNCKLGDKGCGVVYGEYLDEIGKIGDKYSPNQ